MESTRSGVVFIQSWRVNDFIYSKTILCSSIENSSSILSVSYKFLRTRKSSWCSVIGPPDWFHCSASSCKHWESRPLKSPSFLGSQTAMGLRTWSYSRPKWRVMFMTISVIQNHAHHRPSIVPPDLYVSDSFRVALVIMDNAVGLWSRV